MDNLEATRRQLSRRLILAFVAVNTLTLASYWLLAGLGLKSAAAFGSSLGIDLVLSLLVAKPLSGYAHQPLRALGQAIMHLSPTEHGVAAPAADKLSLGQELVTSLTAQVYQLANVASQTAAENQRQLSDLHHNS